MAGNNGVKSVGSNGTTRPTSTATNERAARRIVLLLDGEQSEVGEVLLELKGTEITGKRLHAEVQKQRWPFPVAGWRRSGKALSVGCDFCGARNEELRRRARLSDAAAQRLSGTLRRRVANRR